MARVMDDISLMRAGKDFREEESDLIESELNMCLWRWAMDETSALFAGTVLPLCRRLDRLRAVYLRMLSRRNQGSWTYRVVAATAGQYAGRLLKENEAEFVKPVVYAPCCGCFELYRNALRAVYRSLLGASGNEAAYIETLEGLNEALMESDDIRLRLLSKHSEELKEPRREEKAALIAAINKRIREINKEWKEMKASPEYVLRVKHEEDPDCLKALCCSLEEKAGKLEAIIGKERSGSCPEEDGIAGSGVIIWPGVGKGYLKRCIGEAIGRVYPEGANYGGLVFGAMRRGETEYVTRLMFTMPWLVSARDEFGGTPLHRAVLDGRPELVELLLLFGADIEARSTVTGGLGDGIAGETPLMAALKKGADMKALEILLERGAKMEVVDSCCNSPIIVAVKNSNYFGLAKLLEHGMDPNYCGNEYNYSALNYILAKNMAEPGNEEKWSRFVALLLSRGADPEARFKAREKQMCWEEHYKKKGIPLPEGWTYASQIPELLSPIELTGQGTVMRRLILEAIGKRHPPVQEKLIRRKGVPDLFNNAADTFEEFIQKLDKGLNKIMGTS